MARRSFWALFLLATGNWGCGWFTRTHPLQAGIYQITLTSITSDGCGQASVWQSVSGPPSLGPGQLEVAGDTLRFFLDLYQIDLRGFFKADTEEFIIDGSGGGRVEVVSGKTCPVQLITVGLEAVTVDPHTFSGKFRVMFDTHGDDACTCNTFGDFQADLLAQ